ncbi:MAG: hypothetical protein EXR79_05545 [Myxococcales bacterium]|nr:hypothetical protein [Myxococcales bacterium]
MGHAIAHQFLGRHAQGVLAATLVGSLAAGCLSPSYEIPRDELDRLMAVAPRDRGKHVRAVQRFATADMPPPAAAWSDPSYPGGEAEGGPGVPVAPHYGLYHSWWGPPYWSPASGRTTSMAAAPASGAATSPLAGSLAREPGRAARNAQRSDTSALLAGVLVVATVSAVSLAVSEGARYDGHVAVHPHHPLHLMRLDGKDTVVGLDDLRPEYLAPDTTAVIVGNEGAGLWLRGRRPLDRVGGTYRVGFGAYALALPGGDRVTGSGGDIGVGYFPAPWAGLLLNFGLVTGQGAGGSLWALRPGVEGHLYPLPLWRLHLGGFLGAGDETYSIGGGFLPEADGHHTFVDAGFGAELDLTTRLAITFKYGWHWAPNTAWRDDKAPFSSIGFAIY